MTKSATKKKKDRNRLIMQGMAVFMLLILVMGIIAKARADEGLKAEVVPSVDTLSIGDPIALDLSVTHPQDTRVIFPDFGKNWGDFEVRSQSAPEITQNDDGTETSHQRIEVTLFNIGTFQTLPLSVQVVAPDGTSQEVVAPAVSLTVVSVLQDGETDIRDIKGQASLPVPSNLPFIAGGVILALVVLAILAYLVRRWRYRPIHAAGVIDMRPAHIIALDDLAKIEGMKLVEAGHFKEHYTLVSDTLRRYLDRGFGISAIDQTTAEIRRSIKQSRLSKEHGRRLLDLLSDADMVKFAKFVPEFDDANTYIEEARRFVETTHAPIQLETQREEEVA